MDALARKLYAAGKIADLCEGLGFYQRCVLLFCVVCVLSRLLLPNRPPADSDASNPKKNSTHTSRPTTTYTNPQKHRMHALERQFKGASVLLHKTPGLPPSFQRLWTDARLLDAAQQLLGGKHVDVAGHPGESSVLVNQHGSVCVLCGRKKMARPAHGHGRGNQSQHQQINTNTNTTVWNLRVKVPQADSAVVPWHQGVFTDG